MLLAINTEFALEGKQEDWRAYFNSHLKGTSIRDIKRSTKDLTYRGISTYLPETADLLDYHSLLTTVRDKYAMNTWILAQFLYNKYEAKPEDLQKLLSRFVKEDSKRVINETLKEIR